MAVPAIAPPPTTPPIPARVPIIAAPEAPPATVTAPAPTRPAAAPMFVAVLAAARASFSSSDLGYRVHTSQSKLDSCFERGINRGQPHTDSRPTNRRNRLWRPKAGKKGAALYAAMGQHQSVNIRQISRTRAEQVGYYRFLENENVTVSELVRSLSEHCQQQVEKRHVLAISDSSEINLQSHAGRLKPDKLGVVGNNTDVGFYIHPTLVLDAENGFPLGLSTVQLWSRDLAHQDKHERKYQHLPIEQKESYKWLASAERSQWCLSNGGATMVTHIGDRESDLYEEWATVPNQHNHVLVRVCQDRRLLGQSQSLYTYLREQPCQGTYTIDLPADPRIGRTAREAMLIIRCALVQIQRPDKLKAQDYPPSITLYAVEALEVIEWYRWRWRIEQLFATLKKAGLNLEATQLESVEAIQRLTVLALGVAVRTLQMVE